MLKNCARCGIEMECHYNRIYCPACAKVQKKARQAEYKAAMKNSKPKTPKTPAPPAPSMSIAQVNAMARKHGTSYGKYVVGLEKNP